MAKRGGLKRKIAIEKIEKKTSRGPCYSKRCNGLFGKASQLCLLSGAQIAVLATPMSENSNASFFSFGHSSVHGIVSSYLSGKRPSENTKHTRDDMGICLTQKALGLRFWWEDEILTKSQDAKEVREAIDSMKKLLKDAKKLGSVNNQLPHLDDHDNKEIIKKQSDLLGKNQEPDQTLNFQPDDCLNKTNDTEIVVLDADDDDDLPAVFNDKTGEHDQILPICCANNFNNVLDMDIDDVYQLIDFDSTDSVFDNTHQELPEDHLVSHHGTPEPDNKALGVENLDQTLTTDDSLQNKDTQIMANSQGYNMALPAGNLDGIDMRDIDQLIDSESFLSYDGVLETSFESLLSSDGAFESNQAFAASYLTSSDSLDSMDPSMFFDGDLVLQNRGFNDDHLHFSDVFNELTPIVTL